MKDYVISPVSPNKVIPVRGNVILLSFLSDREFYRIFKVLDRAKIPYFSKNRNDNHPLVIAGGAAMFQPEPIADLIDVVCIGDGEDFLLGLNDALDQNSRQAKIDALAELPGAYVPSRRTPVYDDTGIFVKDMLGETTPIIPNITSLWFDAPQFKGHQREIELARGCNMSCNFCSITWRNKFRVRPKRDVIKTIESDGSLAFCAPNIGGIDYYSTIHSFRGKSTKGDITVSDFIKLPNPESGEYTGHTFTFGIEGIVPRLRKILGKPIPQKMIREMLDRLYLGEARRLQLYFIRNVPSENYHDWLEWHEWWQQTDSEFRGQNINAEIQFTPLTKQAHTPLQYFNHEYNTDSEKFVNDLLKKFRSEDDKQHYLTRSRLAKSWLIDNVTNCTGRNGVHFLWVLHKGGLKSIKSGFRSGAGLVAASSLLNSIGINSSALLGEWPIDSVLPWSHIQPMGEDGTKKRLKVARSLKRQLSG
jgi:hypothetical protein